MVIDESDMTEGCMNMKWKKYVAGIMSVVLLAACPGQILSAEETDATAEESAAETTEKTAEELAEEEKQAAYNTTPDTNNLKNWPAGPNVYAASAIVMDIGSGAVLYAKKPDETHYPASITKLLTTLVALENASLTDTVTFTEECINFLNYDEANIGMKAGEQISLNDALYAVLLASANEVSYAVAKNVGEQMGGSYDTFIQLMNERAIELGCTGSNWVNANGLHDENHYTTAQDMALIAAAVYQLEEFRTIEQTLQYTIGATNLVAETRTFQQNHKMLWPESDYYYEYAKAGKTGFTDQSGTTLVTVADNGNLQLVAVVLDDYGVTAYMDTRSMFDYVYSNFSKVSLEENETSEYIESFVNNDAYVLLPAGITFSDLDCEITQEDENSTTGTATYTYDGQNVGSAEVVLSEAYLEGSAEEETLSLEEADVAETEEAEETGDDIRRQEILLALQFAVPAVAAVVIILAAVHITDRRRKKKRG